MTQGGWSSEDVDAAFAAVAAGDTQTPEAPTPSPASATGVRSSVSTPDSAPTPDALAAQLGHRTKRQPTVVGVTAPGRRQRTRLRIGLVLSLVLAIIGGGLAYAYVQYGSLLFAKPPYTADTLISGLMRTAANIHSLTYTVNGSLKVEPRDADAVPFALSAPTDNRAELLALQHDASRMQTVTNLLSVLRYVRGTYPASLEQLLSGTASSTLSRYTYGGTDSPVSAVDPVTGVPFGYAPVNDGTDFSLRVTFESPEAITAVKRSYGYAATTTIVQGQTVTFTKASSPYITFSAQPSRPFLATLADQMQSLPAEMNAMLSLKATTDWSAGPLADWTAALDAQGSFGDLSYKLGADVDKKADTYYLRIRNAPSLFGLDLSLFKNQWVKYTVTADTTATAPKSLLGYAMQSLSSAETSYKEDRAAFVMFLGLVAKHADETHLFTLAAAPAKQVVDGQVRYLYTLTVNREAVVPFMDAVLADVRQNDALRAYVPVADAGLLEYLKSDKFTEALAYYNKNTTLTVAVDAAGYLADLTYSLRLVPPDTAIALKDKQVRATFNVSLADINKPVVVAAPADAKTVDELEQAVEAAQYSGTSYSAQQLRDQKRTRDLYAIELSLNAYYRAHHAYPQDIYADPAFADGAYLSDGVPNDPTGARYVYVPLGTTGSCTGYHLGAGLETASSALVKDADNAPGTSCVAGVSDFDGKAPNCVGTTPDELDTCYDLAPGTSPSYGY